MAVFSSGEFKLTHKMKVILVHQLKNIESSGVLLQVHIQYLFYRAVIAV